ncbi:MAG: GLUG motif-containing protein [bacterium]
MRRIISYLVIIFFGCLYLRAQVEPPDTDGNGYRNISTLDHLRWISENDSSWSWNFELDNDIDASDTRNWNIGDHDNNPDTPDSAMGFKPIGWRESDGTPFGFTGKFKGANFLISNLFIYRSKERGVGFFGCVNDSGLVDFLGIINAEIHGNMDVGIICGSLNSYLSSKSARISYSYSTGKVGGNKYVGGFCGTNDNGIINNCHSICEVHGIGEYLGGFCGDNYNTEVRGSITNCYSICNVKGNGSYVGGFCGGNKYYGIITNCYSSGIISGNKYVGGFCGYNDNIITNCYSLVEVKGSSEVGGFIGMMSSYDKYEVTNCFSIGEVVCSGGDVGGFCGGTDYNSISNCFWDIDKSKKSTSRGGTGKTTLEMKTPNTYDNWDSTSVWNIKESEYPTLKTFTNEFSGSGSGTNEEPYQITNIQQFQEIFYNPSASYIITQDMDASETKKWNTGKGYYPVCQYSGFTGKLNGNGHFIRNLYINRPNESDIGVFGTVREGIVESLNTLSVEITGNNHVGAFCGQNNNGRLLNSSTSGNIKGSWGIGGFVGLNCYKDIGIIVNCSSECKIIGESNVGGFCGSNDFGYIIQSSSLSTIDSCFWQAGGFCGSNQLSIISKCFSLGKVNGGQYAGGFCGNNDRTIISNCFSRENVKGKIFVGGFVAINRSSEISKCYSECTIQGDSSVGAFCSINSSVYSVIDDSYWDLETSNILISDGGEGKTTTEMKTQNTFVNWDFENIWAIDPNTNDGYPYLQGFPIVSVEENGKKADNDLISIYPNPATDFLCIENNSESQIKKIEIFNLLGEKVLLFVNDNGSQTIKINISGLQIGNYYLKVIHDNEVAIKNFLVFR